MPPMTSPRPLDQGRGALTPGGAPAGRGLPGHRALSTQHLARCGNRILSLEEAGDSEVGEKTDFPHRCSV